MSDAVAGPDGAAFATPVIPRAAKAIAPEANIYFRGAGYSGEAPRRRSKISDVYSDSHGPTLVCPPATPPARWLQNRRSLPPAAHAQVSGVAINRTLRGTWWRVIAIIGQRTWAKAMSPNCPAPSSEIGV